MTKEHKRLCTDLDDYTETLEEATEVMRLNRRYIKHCTKQFKRDKCAFIYGKKMNEAHYITDKNKGVFNTMQRISKLDPKYMIMVQEMADQLKQQEDDLLIF